MENQEKSAVRAGPGVAARVLVFASYVGLLGLAASSWARPAPHEAAPARFQRSGLVEEQACGAELPPGHPPIETRLQLPPGHPPLPSGPRLPAGHPPIDSAPLPFAAPSLPVVTI
jgi:hypothetical protein